MEHVEQNMLNNIIGWSQQNSDSRKLHMTNNPVFSTNKLHRREGEGVGERVKENEVRTERKRERGREKGNT